MGCIPWPFRCKSEYFKCRKFWVKILRPLPLKRSVLIISWFFFLDIVFFFSSLFFSFVVRFIPLSLHFKSYFPWVHLVNFYDVFWFYVDYAESSNCALWLLRYGILIKIRSTASKEWDWCKSIFFFSFVTYLYRWRILIPSCFCQNRLPFPTLSFYLAFHPLGVCIFAECWILNDRSAMLRVLLLYSRP